MLDCKYFDSLLLQASIMHEDSAEKQIDDIFRNIEANLSQKPPRKNLEADVNKDLKKIRNIIAITKDPLLDSFKKQVTNRENVVKQKLQKIKPVNITAEERAQYKEELEGILKQIEKKVAALHEKNNNKRRQANIEYFREHQGKLTMFVDWLSSPSRKFPADIMKNLMSYVRDLTMSQDDAIFQDDLRKIYEKIICAANEPAEINQSAFLSSYINRPRINDYLLTKQTKEILPTNSILPQYKMIDLSVIPKMPKEIHFFMFYFHKGETEQYLAAKQLMKNSWRFYKRFCIWLRRNASPTFDGPDYETGKYLSMNSDLAIKEKTGIKVYHNSLLRTL